MSTRRLERSRWKRKESSISIVGKTEHSWQDNIQLDEVREKERGGIIIIIIHSFYIALFSALEQTHCAHWHVILNE